MEDADQNAENLDTGATVDPPAPPAVEVDAAEVQRQFEEMVAQQRKALADMLAPFESRIVALEIFADGQPPSDGSLTKRIDELEHKLRLAGVRI